jgi:hypothetical protein
MEEAEDQPGKMKFLSRVDDCDPESTTIGGDVKF